MFFFHIYGLNVYTCKRAPPYTQQDVLFAVLTAAVIRSILHESKDVACRRHSATFATHQLQYVRPMSRGAEFQPIGRVSYIRIYLCYFCFR